MINICQDCNALREYPNARVITVCPRCGSINIKHKESPKTQAERNKLLLDCIKGPTIN